MYYLISDLLMFFLTKLHFKCLLSFYTMYGMCFTNIMLGQRYGQLVCETQKNVEGTRKIKIFILYFYF